MSMGIFGGDEGDTGDRAEGEGEKINPKQAPCCGSISQPRYHDLT